MQISVCPIGICTLDLSGELIGDRRRLHPNESTYQIPSERFRSGCNFPVAPCAVPGHRLRGSAAKVAVTRFPAGARLVGLQRMGLIESTKQYVERNGTTTRSRPLQPISCNRSLPVIRLGIRTCIT